ncbi:hypothetical protein E2562_026609 [Oryza meyeriana var. granulata]|uniref:Uncharacterized protein n=1 Tax=Oryza meyeriana var. granulata TaxID=110450 RepID=A0A6G1CUT6_9ORYZ|nr:hypothetical protein E2562_026609 [Oryza meyeriana var. granulata]
MLVTNMKDIKVVFDSEFSRKKTFFRGKNIIPEIRNQGQQATCVFNALFTAAEMEMAISADLRHPSCDMRLCFDVDSFFPQYEYYASK